MYISANYGNYFRAMKIGATSIYSRLYSQVLNPKGTSLYDSKGFINTNAIKYVQNLKANAKDLKSAADNLSRRAAYRGAVATSANQDVMSVQASSASRAARDITVYIRQIATGQINKGSAKNVEENAGIQGYQQFALEIGGKKHQVSFMADAGDTNFDIQQKIADAINQEDIGVYAEIISEHGQTMLNIQSRNTGLDNQNLFTISNVLGNAASAFNLGNMVQNAQNAKYRINRGDLLTSKSNTVDIGNGVEATFKKASDQPVAVSISKDSAKIIRNVSDLIDSYNALLETVDGRSDESARQLRQSLISVVCAHSSSLEQMGIQASSQGYLSIDLVKMAAAAKEEKIEQFFFESRGAHFGFRNRLSRIADEVNSNIAKYISQDKPQMFKSVLNNRYYNMIYRSQFYQAYNIGLLFDFWL